MTHSMEIKGRFFLLRHDVVRERSATHSISDARARAGEDDGLQAEKGGEANPAIETQVRDSGQVC
jgi:hypothetical protein